MTKTIDRKTDQLCPVHLGFCTLIRLEVLQHTTPIHMFLHDEKRVGIEGREAEDLEDVGMGEGAERFYSLEDVLWMVVPRFESHSGRGRGAGTYFMIDRSILQQLDRHNFLSLTVLRPRSTIHRARLLTNTQDCVRISGYVFDGEDRAGIVCHWQMLRRGRRLVMHWRMWAERHRGENGVEIEGWFMFVRVFALRNARRVVHRSCKRMAESEQGL